MKDTLLEVSGVKKRFQGAVALADASLTVRAGEVHALVGENGAGKSTLVNILCGVVQPDEGRMRYLGEKYVPASPQDAYRAHIRVVFQHLSLIPNLTVTENLFVGRELIRHLGFVNHRAMAARARELLDELGFSRIPVKVAVTSLSTSQKYLVEIAKALLVRPRLIILDEPTAALNDAETRVLFDLTRALRAEGCGVIWITHRLEELFQIADRVTVMRDGRYVETRQTASLSYDELIRLMTARDIAESKRPDPGVIGSVCKIKAEDMHTARTLRGLSLQVHEGEILGLGGLAGSGIEDVGRALFGLTPLTGGRVEILGRSYLPRQLKPRLLFRRGVFYLPGDRQTEGIIQSRPVVENASVSSLDAFSRAGFLARFRERSTVAGYVERLRVKVASQALPIGLASGGNQQKILFARGMMTDPQVFILEEPTQGVDVGAKADIYAVIRELAATGAAVLLISADTRELLTVCHRIIAVCRGRVSREFTHDEADEESLVAAYFGTGMNRETA